jgi:biotin carboxyl carrier protein
MIHFHDVHIVWFEIWRRSPGFMKENSTRHNRVPLLLPVRAKFAPWQTIKAWFYHRWQRWQTPRLRMQPPLQPGRHQPFPRRPHQQRRQTVFAALDAAPTGLTRRQLIAHVRAVTGIGCSEKLITQWRQEQRDEATNGRTIDAVRRKRIIQLRSFLLCVLLGATIKPWHPAHSVAAQEIIISPAPSAIPVIPYPATPRLLRIKLTLQNPRELQVKVGDEIQAGEVLSDQRLARQRLLVQKRTLAAVLHHLHTQQLLTAQSLQQLQSLGLDLPSTTFASEQAAIIKAQAEAVVVNRAVKIQQQKLAVVSDWWPVVGTGKAEVERRRAELLTQQPPSTEYQSLITSHESAKLTHAQEQLAIAQSEIEWHKAQLLTAREARAFAAQQHRVEATRQTLSVRTQQQQAAIECARLAAQLAELNLQLAQRTAIRAPFAGTIKRIEWEDMNDETITVLVYLAVAQ